MVFPLLCKLIPEVRVFIERGKHDAVLNSLQRKNTANYLLSSEHKFLLSTEGNGISVAVDVFNVSKIFLYKALKVLCISSLVVSWILSFTNNEFGLKEVHQDNNAATVMGDRNSVSKGIDLSNLDFVSDEEEYSEDTALYLSDIESVSAIICTADIFAVLSLISNNCIVLFNCWFSVKTVFTVGLLDEQICITGSIKPGGERMTKKAFIEYCNMCAHTKPILGIILEACKIWFLNSAKVFIPSNNLIAEVSNS